MEEYEFITGRIYQKGRNKATWEIVDGTEKFYIEVEFSENDVDYGKINLLNTLGKEGWFLGSNSLAYTFTMQRKVKGSTLSK